MARATAYERFVGSYTQLASGCHLWRKKVDPNGYGRFHLDGKSIGAHRAALILCGTDEEKEAIASGGHVLHSCGLRSCVNLEHLRVGTPLENINDAIREGTFARGERSGAMKLSDAQVRSLRVERLEGATGAELAARYGITQNYAYNLTNDGFRASEAVTITAEDVERMRSLRAAGHSVSAIAEAFGVTHRRVRYHVSKPVQAEAA